MNTIKVNINLDPIRDGAIINPNRIMKKTEGALIMATNGKSKIISEIETYKIVDYLSGNNHGDFMESSSCIAILNSEKIFEVEGKKYFVGSAVIVKNTKGGITMLSGDDFEKAAKEFKSRLITLVGDDQEFSAYELSQQ